MRHPSLIAATVLLLLIGGLGLRSAAGEWRDALALGQRVATGTELIYGVLAIVGGLGLLMGRGWTTKLLVAWAVAFTATGALAPVVWGGTKPLVGLVAGVATGLVAYGIVRLSSHAAASRSP